MDHSEYGVLIAMEKMDDFTRYVVRSDLRVFTVDAYDSYNKVRIEGASDFTWTDTIIDNNTFMRELGKNVLYIRDNEIIVKSKELSAKPFRKLASHKTLTNTNEFMTLDIETVNIDNSMKPYLICGYNPSHFISSRIVDVTDLNQRFKLVNDFMDQLYNIPKVKYVYAHNLSNFDGIFLLKYLLKIRYSSLRR